MLASTLNALGPATSTTYLIMPQSHPPRHLFLPPRQTQHIPQRPNLQLIKVLIHRILHQRLQLQNALLNLEPGLVIHPVPLIVGLCCPPFRSIPVGETKERGVGRGQAGFERVGAAVEDLVYGIDDVVDEGLGWLVREKGEDGSC